MKFFIFISLTFLIKLCYVDCKGIGIIKQSATNNIKEPSTLSLNDESNILNTQNRYEDNLYPYSYQDMSSELRKERSPSRLSSSSHYIDPNFIHSSIPKFQKIRDLNTNIKGEMTVQESEEARDAIIKAFEDAKEKALREIKKENYKYMTLDPVRRSLIDQISFGEQNKEEADNGKNLNPISNTEEKHVPHPSLSQNTLQNSAIDSSYIPGSKEGTNTNNIKSFSYSLHQPYDIKDESSFYNSPNLSPVLTKALPNINGNEDRNRRNIHDNTRFVFGRNILPFNKKPLDLKNQEQSLEMNDFRNKDQYGNEPSSQGQLHYPNLRYPEERRTNNYYKWSQDLPRNVFSNSQTKNNYAIGPSLTGEKTDARTNNNLMLDNLELTGLEKNNYKDLMKETAMNDAYKQNFDLYKTGMNRWDAKEPMSGKDSPFGNLAEAECVLNNGIWNKDKGICESGDFDNKDMIKEIYRQFNIQNPLCKKLLGEINKRMIRDGWQNQIQDPNSVRNYFSSFIDPDSNFQLTELEKRNLGIDPRDSATFASLAEACNLKKQHMLNAAQNGIGNTDQHQCELTSDQPNTSKHEAVQQILVQLYQAEAQVQMEANEVARAQQVATASQQALEEATNRVRILSSELQAAQLSAQTAAKNAHTAQLQLAQHDQRMFSARKKVDELSAQMVQVQADLASSSVNIKSESPPPSPPSINENEPSKPSFQKNNFFVRQ